MMRITDIFPSLLMIALFVYLGYLLGRVLPGYRTLIPRLLTRKGYYTELEGLRGLLAITVVVHHCMAWYFLLEHGSWEIHGANAGYYTQLGTFAVTMFFFITGFLFWSKLINSKGVSFGAFMYARMRRLAPAYLASAVSLFILVAIFSHFQLHERPFGILREMAEWATFSVIATPVLNGFTETNHLWAVTWTLRMEFVFYLLIPFVIWFSKTVWKTLFFVALCNVLFQLTLFVNTDHPPFTGFFLVQAVIRFLSFSFSIGILTAHLIRMDIVKKMARSVLAAPVAFAIFLATLFFAPAQHGPIESLLLSIPFIVIAAGNDFWGTLRSSSFLFLGQISYSVYLTHCLILGAILLPLYLAHSHVLANPVTYWSFVALVGPLIIVVSTLWNRVFEMPFMGKKSGAVDRMQPPATVNNTSPAEPVRVEV
jgi:peptidoglycan/LPS O-acetylase OafA/YrhL